MSVGGCIGNGKIFFVVVGIVVIVIVVMAAITAVMVVQLDIVISILLQHIYLLMLVKFLRKRRKM